MANAYFQIFFLLSTFFFLSHCEEDKPDMVVVIARHGAREPLSLRFDTSWQSPSYLMDIGVHQHYALGTLLAKKYENLVKDISPSEIYLQSTEYHRTQMSVSAELLGLFHDQTHKHTEKTIRNDFKIPFEDQNLINEISQKIMNTSDLIPNRLQLLTQKVLPDLKEDLLQIDPANCLAVRKGQQKRFTDTVNRKMTTTLIGSINQLRRLHYKISQVYDLKEMGDVLMNRYIAGKPALDGIPYGSTVYNDAVFAFKWWNMYNLVGTELERSLRVFPVYNRLIEWFTQKSQGKTHLKLALLGSHESTMFPFLSLFNITDNDCFFENYKAENAGQALPFPECIFPEYGSQLIFEFYNKTESPYIRMLYNGKPKKLCRGSEGVECTLSMFIEELPIVLNNMTQERHQAECSVDAKPASSAPTSVTQTTSQTNKTTLYAQNIEEESKTPHTVESQDTDYNPKVYANQVEEEIKRHEKEWLEKKSESLKNVAKDSLIIWLIVAVAVLGTIFTFIVFLLVSGRLVLSDEAFTSKPLNDSSEFSNSFEMSQHSKGIHIKDMPVQGGDSDEEEDDE